MNFPLSTGEVARTVDVTEPELNRLIRRGKIRPEPPIRSGRRAWSLQHLHQAAAALGIALTPDLRAEVEQDREVSDAS